MNDTIEARKTSTGTAQQLGAILTDEGVNFALFSEHAKGVLLVLFDSPDGPPVEEIRVENKTDNVWHVFVHGLKAGQLYGYKVDGDYNPKEGLRFNPNKLLIDPYAKALTQKPGVVLCAYDVSAPDKDLVMDPQDNSAIAPKSIVIDDRFDWQGDQKPNIPKEDMIIYETHVKGFTASPTSQVQKPGTYLGFIEKIPYLKDLGVNAIELLPIQAFYVQSYVQEKGLTNYWGYDTIGFFAPSSFYSTKEYPGCQVNEFKTLVKEIHKAGMEVILDVVYNHTAEGNQLGPTICFKGIDNSAYYYLVENGPEEPYRFYREDTGCGNTFRVEHPMAMKLVIDSLRYWVQEMHIDGFRFDLATVLGHKDGRFDKEAEFFKAIAEDPVLKNVKLLAEPWDLTTYQAGNFPKGWMEWNGKFRDTVRRFIKGDDAVAGETAKRFAGSADLYADQGRDAFESVNFVTCHDGFTLHDVFAYDMKHNENNKEDNRDGANDNFSWNCGFEGPTDNRDILNLRKSMVKNAFCFLFFSVGTPMVLGGDEFMRTQQGNNNTWCQDNEISWYDWELLKKNADVHQFFKKAIALRKRYPLLGKAQSLAHIKWFERTLENPDWEKPHLKTLCIGFGIDEQSPADMPPLFFIFNGRHRGTVIHLPEHIQWSWFIDTSRPAGKEFYDPDQGHPLRRANEIYCPSYTTMVLSGKRK